MSSLMLSLLDKPAPDITPAQIASLRKEIERGAASCLSPEKEAGPFMLYLLGNNYLQVTEQCGWPLNVVLMTALKYNWFEKKQLLELDNQKESARHVIKQAVNSMLATTTAVILKQMQMIMKGELDPLKCSYIPKDVYGMEKFLSVCNQLHRLTEKTDNSNVQNSNVNVANLPPGSAHHQQIQVVEGQSIKELSSLTLEEYNAMPREQRLKSLSMDLKKE